MIYVLLPPLYWTTYYRNIEGITQDGKKIADWQQARTRPSCCSANTTLGVLMATINSSIVLISLPAIFNGIGINPLGAGNTNYLLWMLMGYMLLTATLVVSLGSISDMFGRVRLLNQVTRLAHFLQVLSLYLGMNLERQAAARLSNERIRYKLATRVLPQRRQALGHASMCLLSGRLFTMHLQFR